MTELIKRITTFQDYWKAIVIPDYEAFRAEPADLRLACHCATSLFHMTDWVFHSNKVGVTNSFNLENRNGKDVDEIDFANHLASKHPNFELIRKIAHSWKHLQLKSKGSNPDAPTNAANNQVVSTGWGEGGFGQGPWGGVLRVTLETDSGPRDFSDIAQSVFEMWLQISADQNWQLPTE